MTKFIKNLFTISLVIVFMQCLSAGCAVAQDFSTDKAVREELAKISDFKSLDRLCIKRLKESAKIIVIGNRANDRDCEIDGAFINSRYFEMTNAALSKTALNTLGWEAANRQKREKLATLLVEKVLFAFSAKSNQTFQAVSTSEGGIKVIVSLKYPPGVTSRNASKIFVFDKDGSFSAAGDY